MKGDAVGRRDAKPRWIPCPHIARLNEGDAIGRRDSSSRSSRRPHLA